MVVPQANRDVGRRLVAVSLGFLTLASAAAGRLDIDDEHPVPVAVPALVAGSVAAEAPAREFADTLARALRVSGRFRPLPEDRYPTDPRSRAGVRPPQDFTGWSAAGAVLLVGGELGVEAGAIVADVRLYDVFDRRAVVARRYRGRREDAARMARRFADVMIGELTGRRGPFDSRIVFLSRRGARVGRVWTVAPDGGEAAPLSRDDAWASPAWGGGAASLLVTWFRYGTPDLFAWDARSGERVRLAGGAGLHLGARPDPGGRRLAVAVEDEDGQLDIVLLDRRGRFVAPVTRHPAADLSPSWSPDGRQLVFASDRTGAMQLYVVDVGGDGEPRRLPGQPPFAADPEWSPDGSRIAFTGGFDGRLAVMTIGAAGGDLQEVVGGGADASEPTWSPDGRYLAFVAGPPGNGAIAVVELRSRTVSRLTGEGGGDSSPSWSDWLR